MQFQYTPYILPIFFASAISVWIVSYGWRHRARQNALLLTLSAAALTEWLVFYGLQISGANLQTKVLVAEIKYIGVALTPLFWVLFALGYTSQNKSLTRRTIILLALIPALTGILAVTTRWHGLFWSKPYLTEIQGFADFGVTYGPWYWVHVGYSYLLIILGTIILFRSFRHRQGLHRQQIIALSISALTPWVGNLLYFFGLNPIPNLDLTPFAFTITVFLITWAILGFRLVALAPIARDLLVDKMQDGMIVLDTQAQIMDVNPAAEKLLNIPAAQLIGHPAGEMLKNWAELVKRYSQALDLLEEINLELAGEQRWFELRISPLYDQNQRLLGRVIVLHDITARKATEKALTAALEQAEEASRLKSQLLARVSHELRTPLGSILGFAELLQMESFGEMNESQKDVLAQIVESSHYLDGIITELLDQTQLAAEILVLQNAPFSPKSLVQKACEHFAATAKSKGLALNWEIAPEIPKTLYGDEFRLGQILTNLVGNAVKFTEQGQVDVRLSCAAATSWTISVTDTGPGIPKEAQAYIFEPFRQVNQAITRENRGAGLGLAITRQLVTLMKGEILVESEPGQGSQFTVTLPLLAA